MAWIRPMRHAGPRQVCDDWLHLAATDRAYKMTRDQRRMRSGYAGPPADWSICNRHWLWALDGRVAKPSRRNTRFLQGSSLPILYPPVVLVFVVVGIAELIAWAATTEWWLAAPIVAGR